MLPALYRSLLRTRRVGEEVARAYPIDVIKRPVPFSIGQESVSVGVCSRLAPGGVPWLPAERTGLRALGFRGAF